MQTFRFYAHIWTPSNGHCDKRYLIKGETLADATSKLLGILADRDPKILVNFTHYQVVGK
jgi:hypothetical protein